MNMKIIQDITTKYLKATTQADPTYDLQKAQEFTNQLKVYLEECYKSTLKVSILLHFSIILYWVNEEDRALNLLDTISKDDPLYAKSLLIRTFIQEEIEPIDETAYNNLIEMSEKVEDKELRSMLLFCANYYWKLTFAEKKELLLKSVASCNLHVRNLQWLASLYFQKGNKIEGRKLMMQAIYNVIEMSDRSITEDITNPDEFINRNIKGTHTSKYFFTEMLKCIDPTN